MPAEQSDQDDGAPLIWRARGPILFAALLALCMIAYAWSVLDASRRTTDWLLILPVAVIGVTALAVAAFRDLRDTRDARRDAAPAARPTVARGSNDRASLGLVLAVLAFALAIPWLGFDVGTLVFVAVALLVQGERRWWVIGLTSILTAVLLVLIFQTVLGVRVPTLLM